MTTARRAPGDALANGGVGNMTPGCMEHQPTSIDFGPYFWHLPRESGVELHEPEFRIGRPESDGVRRENAAPSRMMDFEERWHIVRDARAGRGVTRDAAFVYAVLTTGVYCRPGCKSRLPRAENVRFFESGLAARRAGYRACKRCKPERGTPPEHDLVQRACRLIEGSEVPPSLAEQARAAGLSSSRFHKLFRATLGITPKQYAAAHGRAELQRALEAGHSVTRAIHAARYSSSSRVYEGGDQLLGMSPKAYRDGGSGEVIRFGVLRCSLGPVLIATSERGICAVDLGGSESDLVHAFERRFAAACKRPLDATSRRWVRAVVREIDGAANGKPASQLPLDIRGTAFQQRVWAALRAVPQGTMTTYSELASGLGAPRAARAVARACAANELAVLVPCHRVVRKDGGLGGYRWGLATKRALLTRERDSGARRSRAVAKARR